MTFRLSEAAIEKAIEHLCRYGDTDIFPSLPELAFFHERKDAVIKELSKLDLTTFSPDGAIEALAPKSFHSFRIAHMLPAVEALILLACTVEIGSQIEAYRSPNHDDAAFAYRFAPSAGGQIFAANRTYRHWLEAQRKILVGDSEISHVLFTDISDFYSRISHHRLFDNLLETCAPNHGAVKYMNKQMKRIRARQSFGLPVGSASARLLAELALSDTDTELVNAGIKFTRFVDDYRIFLKKNEDAFEVLALLAENLGINEGLSLNAAKTRTLSRDAFDAHLERMLTDVKDEATGEALDQIVGAIYFDDEHNEEELEKLSNVNLIEMLRSSISEEQIDFNRVRVIFRALKIIKPIEAAEFIKTEFRNLVIFTKDLVEVMDAIDGDLLFGFDDLLDDIIDAILRPPASSVQTIRTWLLEIFVRGIVQIPLSKLKRLEILTSPLDRRQILLIRGRAKDLNYFRRQKTALHSFSAAEIPYLVWSASCLPADEYEKWLGSVKQSVNKPLFALYIDWLEKNRARLLNKLGHKIEDHP